MMLIFKYLQELWKKWFAKFSFISGVSGEILFYTGIDTNNLIVDFIIEHFLYISLIFLLVATYQVWKDVTKQKQDLELRYKNPIQYEVKAIIKNLKFDLNILSEQFDNKVIESKKLLDEVSKEIIDISKKLESEIYKNTRLLQIASMGLGEFSRSQEGYLSSLKEYKRDLENFSDNKNSYLLKWRNFIENDLQEIYFISFEILNIGMKSDEDIDVKINFGDMNAHIGLPTKLQNSPKLNFPKKPEKPKDTLDLLQPSFDYNHDVFQNFEHPNAYKKSENIKDNKFSITIRDLKVGESTRIFKRNGFFIKLNDKNEIDIEILSKHSTEKIHFKPIFQDGEDIEYFQSDISKLIFG